MAESFVNGQKTLWEKEKLLVTSNFSFSHSVFKRLALQTRKNQGLFGKELSRVVVVTMIANDHETKENFLVNVDGYFISSFSCNVLQKPSSLGLMIHVIVWKRILILNKLLELFLKAEIISYFDLEN